jgi:hypothetical protein
VPCVAGTGKTRRGFRSLDCDRRPGALGRGTAPAHSCDEPGDAARICVRLDGLPLALELVAARVSLLSPSQILERLDQRLKLLTSGGRDRPVRHQTLRDTHEWSDQLLDPEERQLFAQLAERALGWFYFPRSHMTEGRHRSATAVAASISRDANLVRVLTGWNSRSMARGS